MTDVGTTDDDSAEYDMAKQAAYTELFNHIRDVIIPKKIIVPVVCIPLVTNEDHTPTAGKPAKEAAATNLVRILTRLADNQETPSWTGFNQR